MLSNRELSRYERQMLIPDWGKSGQRKLKKAGVLVAGAGGLGSAILTYLAVAGIGNIRIVDSDRVELGNLNRQVLHTDKDISRYKVDSAKEKLELLNPDIKVEAIKAKITRSNIFKLVGNYLIVDALDNLPARLLLNRAAMKTVLPLFHGAVYGFEGRATTIIPGKTACLRCLYQDVLPGKIPVVGVTPAVIGCIQATEVIKYILGTGNLLEDRLLVYDGLSMKFSEVKLKKNPDCRDCGNTADLTGKD
ncbi:MAG: HesA/MoeB/ThiF family protein [Chloroflexi bacterium]|nr:HesA/MoeB/ThiF family protein [Chloroflexota bacterium]